MAGAAASPQTFPCSAVPASSTARGQGTGDRGRVGVGFGQAVHITFQSVGWQDRKGCPCYEERLGWLLKVAQRHQGRKERVRTSPKIIRDAGM